MANPMEKIELLAPAGNIEKFELAVHYGADAAYLSGKNYSLRNFSDNFTIYEIGEAVRIGRSEGVKVYVACNIFPRNADIEGIRDYLSRLGDIGPDAVIIADPGVVMEARRIIPHIPIHLSTQANVTHVGSVKFWESMGIRRINIARESTLTEISEITSQTGVEIEAFVHGAMCIAYSGRCMLSGVMANRESNLGMCCQPCRYKYSVMEEKRPGEYFPVAEDLLGTYIFNSRDLCMIEHLPDMIGAGVRSLKIEGRMKSLNYLATTVKTYREAIDACYAEKDRYTVRPYWRKALNSIKNRGYCTGFYLGDASDSMQTASSACSAGFHDFIGIIAGRSDDGKSRIYTRNNLSVGDRVEITQRTGPPIPDVVQEIRDISGELVARAKPNTDATVKFQKQYEKNDTVKLARPE